MNWNNVAYVSEDTVVLTLHDAENKNSTERLAFAINLLKIESNHAHVAKP